MNSEVDYIDTSYINSEEELVDFKKKVYEKYLDVIDPDKIQSKSKDIFYFSSHLDWEQDKYHLNYKDKKLNEGKYPFWECGLNKIQSFKDYHNNEPYYKFGLREFKKLYDILKEYNIRFVPLSGTLLFPIRDNILLPRNKSDDFDIGILLEDYEKFVKLCIPKIKKHFSIWIKRDEFCKGDGTYAIHLYQWKFMKTFADILIVSHEYFYDCKEIEVDNFKLSIPKNYEHFFNMSYSNWKVPMNEHSFFPFMQRWLYPYNHSLNLGLYGKIPNNLKKIIKKHIKPGQRGLVYDK